jgi:hypothetical protein
MDHSVEATLSIKLENFSSGPASVRLISPVTQSEKEQLSQQQPEVSQKKTSSCLADGRATRSMSTSTSLRKLIIYPNFSISTHVSTPPHSLPTNSIPPNIYNPSISIVHFPGISGITHSALRPICPTPPRHIETSREAHAAAALFDEASTSCCAVYHTRIIRFTTTSC